MRSLEKYRYVPEVSLIPHYRQAVVTRQEKAGDRLSFGGHLNFWFATGMVQLKMCSFGQFEVRSSLIKRFSGVAGESFAKN